MKTKISNKDMKAVRFGLTLNLIQSVWRLLRNTLALTDNISLTIGIAMNYALLAAFFFLLSWAALNMSHNQDNGYSLSVDFTMIGYSALYIVGLYGTPHLLMPLTLLFFTFADRNSTMLHKKLFKYNLLTALVSIANMVLLLIL